MISRKKHKQCEDYYHVAKTEFESYNIYMKLELDQRMENIINFYKRTKNNNNCSLINA